MKTLSKKMILVGLLAVAAVAPREVWAMEAEVNERGEHLIKLIHNDHPKEEVIEYLKTCGKEEVNYHNMVFPLGLVAEKGWFDLIEPMIEKGADVNKAKGIKPNFNDGWTALHYAIVFAPKESVCRTVEVLLKNGANPNARLKGETRKTSFQLVCDPSYMKGSEALLKLLFKYAGINKIKPDLTSKKYWYKKYWYRSSPLFEILGADKPYTEMLELLVENGADVDEQVEINGTMYTPTEWVKEFRDAKRIYRDNYNRTWSYPDYPTQEIVDYLDVASLKKKLAVGKKQNIAGKELQVIANGIRKFDKTFCESFLSLEYFQQNLSKIPQELWCKFDPINTSNLTLVESQEAKKKRSNMVKPDIGIHFVGICECPKCESMRCEEEQKSIVPTRNNALVPYNPAAVAGLLEYKK